MFENAKINVSKYLHKFDAQEGGGGEIAIPRKAVLLC